MCSLFDSIKVELVFSARRNDLTMDGTCQGKFSEASLSLRCVKEYSVTTTIEQNKFEFEGRPSDESEFAGKPYEEKTNESAGTNGSGGKAKGGEAEGEEAEAKPVDINTEIERIFEEIRGKGKIKVRTDKNNKIIAGFNDAFSEAWESRVEKFNIAEGIDLEKIKMEVRTRFRKKAEIAKGSLFGKALKLSDAEENVSKIKRDLDSIGTKENKLDRGLRKVIINTYLKDENIIDIYDDEGNIKGLGEIKEIVKDKMDEFLKKYVGEDYSDQIELVAKDSSQYKKIKRILELTGLEMTDSKEVI